MNLSHPLFSSLALTANGTSSGANLLYNASIAAGLAFLAVSAYSGWRKHAVNLTPVTSATVNADAAPDFLRVDKVARDAALERGEVFEQNLRSREAQEASAPMEPAQKTFCLFAAAMSAFTLVSMLFGSIWQISWIGRYAEELSARGRFAAIVREHPIAFSIAVMVCALQIVRFASERGETAA